MSRWLSRWRRRHHASCGRPKVAACAVSPLRFRAEGNQRQGARRLTQDAAEHGIAPLRAVCPPNGGNPHRVEPVQFALCGAFWTGMARHGLRGVLERPGNPVGHGRRVALRLPAALHAAGEGSATGLGATTSPVPQRRCGRTCEATPPHTRKRRQGPCSSPRLAPRAGTLPAPCRSRFRLSRGTVGARGIVGKRHHPDAAGQLGSLRSSGEHAAKMESRAACSRASMLNPYFAFTARTLSANQQRLRGGSQSAASLSDFPCRFSLGYATVMLSGSSTNSRALAQAKPERLASANATMCSMSTSPTSPNTLQVYGATRPCSRTQATSSLGSWRGARNPRRTASRLRRRRGGCGTPPSACQHGRRRRPNLPPCASTSGATAVTAIKAGGAAQLAGRGAPLAGVPHAGGRGGCVGVCWRKLRVCQPIGSSVSCESFRSSCSTIRPSSIFGSALRPKHIPTPAASVLDLEANLIESPTSRRSNA